MTCNSIYGNTFKIKNQNNLVKVPDFFLKLFNKAKNGRESNSKMILNRSHNKYDMNKVNNLQSYENNINNIKNQSISKKKETPGEREKKKTKEILPKNISNISEIKKDESKISEKTIEEKEKSISYM